MDKAGQYAVLQCKEDTCQGESRIRKDKIKGLKYGIAICPYCGSHNTEIFVWHPETGKLLRYRPSDVESGDQGGRYIDLVTSKRIFLSPEQEKNPTIAMKIQLGRYKKVDH